MPSVHDPTHKPAFGERLWRLPESALKLKTPPGTYRCSWTLSKPPDEAAWESEGDVTILGGRQPSGGVYGHAPMHVQVSPGGGITYGAPQHFDYPTVYGQLINGRDLILIDARLQVWDRDRNGFMSGPNAHFDAWAALVGSGIPETPDVLVDSGVVQLTHLDALAARSPIEEVQFPERPYESEEPIYGAKFRQASCQMWADEDAEVSVEYGISAAIFGSYYFGISFSPMVRIELNKAVPIKDFFTSWVLPLHGLVSAATGENEDITYWSCAPVIKGDKRPAAQRQFQVFTRWVTQQPYASENTVSDKQVSAILLAEGESLLHLLRRWQRLEAEQNPILNTYDIHSLGSDQTPRARFLLLVQALEGLCGHEDRLAGKWGTFETKRQRILDECEQHLSTKDIKFLRKWLASTPYNLDAALGEMLSELPSDLEPELAQSELVKSVVNRVDKVTTTVGALRYVRNQLSHGTETFDPHDLHTVAGILGRVVRGHLLRLLQTSREAQERVLARPER